MCVLLCLIFGLCVLWFVNKCYVRTSCYDVYFSIKYYITSCITQLFIELLFLARICMDIHVYIKIFGSNHRRCLEEEYAMDPHTK